MSNEKPIELNCNINYHIDLPSNAYREELYLWGLNAWNELQKMRAHVFYDNTNQRLCVSLENVHEGEKARIRSFIKHLVNVMKTGVEGQT